VGHSKGKVVDVMLVKTGVEVRISYVAKTGKYNSSTTSMRFDPLISPFTRLSVKVKQKPHVYSFFSPFFFPS
jgi:hypothetical protein